jgi:hypothetical protein
MNHGECICSQGVATNLSFLRGLGRIFSKERLNHRTEEDDEDVMALERRALFSTSLWVINPPLASLQTGLVLVGNLDMVPVVCGSSGWLGCGTALAQR